MSQHNVDEVQDDAATVVSMSMNADNTDEPSTPTNEKDTHIDKGEPETSAPEGLEDQTNFLPTKQVIMVFLGLSIALACAMLDQTMCVSRLSYYMHTICLGVQRHDFADDRSFQCCNGSTSYIVRLLGRRPRWVSGARTQEISIQGRSTREVAITRGSMERVRQ